MWSYANQVTLLRLACTPVVVFLMVYEYHWGAFGFLLFAGLTDVADGFLARLAKNKNLVGVYLDPAVDKILAVSVYATATALGYIPVWLFALVVGRDLLMAACYHVSRRMGYVVEIRPSNVGKATTFVQVGLIVLILFFLALQISLQAIPFLVWVVAGFTVASGVAYCHQWWRGLQSE